MDLAAALYRGCQINGKPEHGYLCHDANLPVGSCSVVLWEIRLSAIHPLGISTLPGSACNFASFNHCTIHKRWIVPANTNGGAEDKSGSAVAG